MGVKLLNSKTNETTICERSDWTKCRDHNANKGWALLLPSPVIISVDEFSQPKLERITSLEQYQIFSEN